MSVGLSGMELVWSYGARHYPSLEYVSFIVFENKSDLFQKCICELLFLVIY